MNIKKLLVGCLLVTSFVKAQEKFEFFDATKATEIPRAMKKKFKRKDALYYCNNYLQVYDNKRYFFVNSSLKKTKKYDFATKMLRGGFFLTGERKEGRNDYGKRETQRVLSLKALNFQGKEITTELSKYPNAYLATNQVRVYDFETTDEGDYIVFQNTINNQMCDGLLNDQGKVIIAPDKKEIIQLSGNYFLVKEQNGSASIFDAQSKTAILEAIEGVVVKNKISYAANFLAYGSKVWVKKEGAIGLYDLQKKTWDIPNVYLDVKPFLGWKSFPGTYSSRRVVYTASYAVKNKDGKWGVISERNVEMVPFGAAGFEKQGNGDFIVIDKEGKKNYYSKKRQGLVLPRSYKNVDSYSPNFVVVKNAANELAVFNGDNGEPYIDFTSEYASFTNSVGDFGFVLKSKANHNSGGASLSVYSTVLKKMILTGLKRVESVSREDNSYYAYDFEGKITVFNLEQGKIIIPFVKPKQFSSVWRYGNYYQLRNFMGKSKLHQCFNTEGKEVTISECMKK